MSKLTYHPIQTSTVEAFRAGAMDANNQPPERALSSGTGMPCRHCLSDIPKDADMLILAHRPFEHLHPYAETGPIFLCADACPAYNAPALPPVLTTSPDYLVKGYTDDERISYGTGKITASGDIPDYAAQLLQDPKIAFVDVRSARNNCFLLRITREA